MMQEEPGQVSAEESSMQKIEREARMLDDKVIHTQDFIKEDAFIRTEEFKNFLFKVKQNELSLQMAPGDTEEKVAKIVQKL